MPTTVKTGWLKDKNGDKFAPKTLTSQVQTSDGILIEDKIKADIDTAKEELAPLVGTTAEITPAQVAEAVTSGRPVAITHTEAPFGSIQYCYFNVSEAMGLILSTGIVDYDGKMTIELYGSIASGEWDLVIGSVAEKDDIPDAVVNPASASVGQIIVVDEVDENGKPTEWKAADYQPRTHWSEIVDGDILPITEFTSVYDESMGINMAQLPLCELEVGKTYTVIYDGVTYTCIAKTGEMNGMAYVGVGNDMFFGGEQTSEPFGVAYVQSSSITGVIPLVEGTHTIRIIGEMLVTHKIPREYLYSKTIDFEWGGQDSGGWMVYSKSNIDIKDIVKEVKSGVMYYARITAPASITGLDYDLPLVMPSIAYNDAMPYGTITGYSVIFECTLVNKQFSLDLMDIPGVAEAGFISFETLVNTDTAVVNPESASVGQTIVVDEVNTNGKPSKWKAADYQERTHGSKWVELLPETTLTFTNSQYQGAHNVLIEPGKTYKVLWNGIEYILAASYFNLGTMAGNGIGNQAAIGGTDTGEPFMLGTDVDGTALLCVELTGAASASVSIIGEEITMIPPKYLPEGIGYEECNVILPETAAGYNSEEKYFYVEGYFPDFVIGDTYVVNWNGVKYNSVAGSRGDNDPYIGNVSLAMGEENTGEPFVIFRFGPGGLVMACNDGSASVTLSITHKKIHTIPEKYLPDMVDKDDILTELKEYADSSAQTKADEALASAKEYADNLKVLPTVTESDNGAFLRVVDGVWAATQLPNIEEGEF